MRTSHFVWVAWLACCLVAEARPRAMTLLTGVTYYEGNEPLVGKLSFLLVHHVRVPSNSLTAASIYSFDLVTKALRKVTDAPIGRLIPSSDPNIHGVLFGLGGSYVLQETNFFIYLDSTKESRTISIGGRKPRSTCLVAGHVFFEVPDFDYSTTGLLDYDVGRDQKRWVRLNEAIPSEPESYAEIHVPRGATNLLHFRYYGRQSSDDGGYSLNVDTGETDRIAEWRWDSHDDHEGHFFKCFENRYLFFEGLEAPIHGFRLLSSPFQDWRKTKGTVKGPHVKVLKVFPKRFAPLGYMYTLWQMSPDGRYALVRRLEFTLSGEVNTYFLVNAADGSTRVLLEDKLETWTKGSMRGFHWGW